MKDFVGIVCASSLCSQIITSMLLKLTIVGSLIIILFQVESRIVESKTVDSIRHPLELILDSELQGMLCNS